MAANELIQRVRIYVSERDVAEGQPLYITLIERLRHEGATGATALRGIAGFGAGHRLRPGGPADLNRTPVVIEWVDRAERVARVLPAIDELLPDALITVEDLRVYRAVLRAGGPFGERTVGEVMARDVAVAGEQMLLRDAAQLMLERQQMLLPVLDERGLVAGVFGADDLTQRAGLALPLRLLNALAPAERAALIDELPIRTLADTMTDDPRTIYIEALIPQAISPLVEWGLSALPVVDRAGQLVGLFGVEQALRAALDARQPGAGAVRDAEPPTPVGLVMQRAVPTVGADATFATALTQVLTAPLRFVVLVDGGRPLGTLSDAHLIKVLDEPFRAAWLGALRTPDAALPAELETLETPRTAADLADTAVPTVPITATQDDAIRLMLDGGHEWLIVVDSAGLLAGLLAQRVLLRALAQSTVG